MIGLFWNIRGLGKLGRLPALVSRIKDSHADIVGILETKKDNFTPGFLKSLTGLTPFDWTYLPARGSAGGILVGANSDLFKLTVGDILDFFCQYLPSREENRVLLEVGCGLWLSI